MKQILAAVTAVFLMGSLAACGSSGETPKNQETGNGNAVVQTAANLLPKEVASSGVLTVGTPASSPPEGFKTESGALDGYEVQLLEEIAGVLGLKVDWQITDFASLIPGLKSARFNVAVGQIGITRERAEIVDFVTLIRTNQAFAALKAAGLHDLTIDDLCGKKVAIIQGSRQQEFGATQSKTCGEKGKPAVDLSVFQSANDAWLAMQSKRTEIYWAGATNVGYLVSKSPEAQVVGHHLQPNPTGIALNKGSSIGPAIEAAFQHLMENGTYQRILEKWGLKDNGVTDAKLNPEITW
ncbi:ABC transporter substrate-binding protein [Pseudarthrobacter sp. CCNWLW207]|uniref:ABC transporter substrate-binding protein n=1 Tax=Pseudarthrobacter sp. CCNWLW207 TaxID=3127468 RepID=UPI00307762F3